MIKLFTPSVSSLAVTQQATPRSGNSSTLKNLLFIPIFMIVCFALSENGLGQVNISAGGTITQNFDGIGTSATATMPTGWKVDKNTTVRTVGAYSAAATATENTGATTATISTTAANGIWNLGSGTDNTGTDRAIGGISSSSASKSVNIYTYLKNNGASSITSFTISYNVEKYRKGTNTAGFSVQMYYSTDGSTWTSAGSDFLTSFTGSDADNTAYATAPGATSSVSSKILTTTVTAGSYIYLAWNISVTSGTTTSNAQMLSIDDVSITGAATSTADASKSTLTPTSASITADGSSTQVLTVQAKDASGTSITTGGATVTITKSSGIGAIGSVTDNSNGTYTATVTSPTSTGIGVFVATLDGSSVKSGTGSQTQATITYIPGAANAVQSTLTPISASITANGSSTQVLTVQSKDANGNNLTSGGSTVAITKSSGTGTIGSVTDNSNGTYTATVTSPASAGTGVFVATLGGSAVKSGTGSQTQATITYTAVPDATQSTLTPTSASITADGSSTQVLTVQAKDVSGTSITTGGATVTITKSSGTGTIGSVTDNGNGTYTATVTSPTATGSGVFVATLGGSAVKSGTGSQTQATITYTVGALDHFAISAISSPQTAGTAITGITITAQDVNNNTQTSFASTVVYSGTAGITGTSASFTAGVLGSVSVTPSVVGSSMTFIVTGSTKIGTATFDVSAASSCIDEGFENGGADPTGWTCSGVTIDVVSPHSGTYYEHTKTVGAYILSKSLTNPATVVFWCEANMADANFTVVLESLIGSTWSTEATYTANGSNTGVISTKYSQIVKTLSSSSIIAVRWRMTANSSARYFYLDDVEICPQSNVVLSSSNPAVATGNVSQGSTSQAIYNFTLAVTSAPAILGSLSFITTNSDAADITKYQLWYNSTNNVSTAIQIGSDITSGLGSGTHTFSGLSQSITSGATGYFWISVDVADYATVTHTLYVSTALTTGNITLTVGNITGTAYAGGIKTIIAGSSTLTCAPSALNLFTYVHGSGPSTYHSYTLSGVRLDGTKSGTITVTAPTDYQVCATSGGTYASSFTISYTAPTLAATTVYVKLKSGLATGTYNNENITNSGGGSTLNIPCSGSVIASSVNAYMTGALVNSCDGTTAGCTEGYNEVLFFNSGSSSIAVTNSATAATNIQVFYGSSSPPSTNYTESYVSNATYISTLNSTAGCGTLFIDALTALTIPANSIFFIMYQAPCYPYNFSAYCGYGPIYVLFSSDADWSVGGNFSNGSTIAAGVPRYFKTVISGTTYTYNYYPYSLAVGGATSDVNDGDGDAVNFAYGGGAATSYFNNGCNPSNAILDLPINLLSFTANCDKKVVDIDWSTASETNNDYFTIERSLDTQEWEVVATVGGAGNSSNTLHYTTKDYYPIEGTSYYRLKQTDFNGEYKYFSPVAVSCKETTLDYISLSPNPTVNMVDCNVNSMEESRVVIEITNYLGQKVFFNNFNLQKGFNKISLDVSKFQSGIYTVIIYSINGEIIGNKKLVIQ